MELPFKLEIPKQHPVLRDPTLPYKPNRKAKAKVTTNSALARGTQIHQIDKKNVRTVQNVVPGAKRQPLIGRKTKYDKRGRIRVAKLDVATLEDPDLYPIQEPSAVVVKRKPSKVLVDEEENISLNEESEVKETVDGCSPHSDLWGDEHASDNERDDFRNSASPTDFLEDSHHLPPSCSPVLISEEEDESVGVLKVATSSKKRKLESEYEDDHLIKGICRIPNWVNTEKRNGLQQVLWEHFADRYPLSRWKRQKVVPAYDPSYFPNVF